MPAPPKPWVDANRVYDFVCVLCGAPQSSGTGWDCGPDTSGMHWECIRVCQRGHATLLLMKPNAHQVVEQLPTPNTAPPVEGIPDTNEDIHKLYEEAGRCLTHSAPTGAVMICRKLLMNLAVEHAGASDDDSYQKCVKALVAANHIPTEGHPLADHICLIGNEANHELPAITRETAERVVTLPSIVLNNIYQLRALSAGL